jgi:hypothetical protein
MIGNGVVYNANVGARFSATAPAVGAHHAPPQLGNQPMGRTQRRFLPVTSHQSPITVSVSPVTTSKSRVSPP